MIRCRKFDKLLINAKESNDINKAIYKNINLLLHYCHNIPTLYIDGSIKDKQFMLRTFIDSIEYYDGELTVKLKPIFDSLRQLKNANILELNSIKGRTREKLSNSEIAGILTQNITESLKIKGRTLKTLIIPNKKDPEGSNLLNGASYGARHEPYCVEFLHLCMHDKYTIEQVKSFLD